MYNPKVFSEYSVFVQHMPTQNVYGERLHRDISFGAALLTSREETRHMHIHRMISAGEVSLIDASTLMS